MKKAYPGLPGEAGLEDLANEAGFSKYHFARLFKEMTGQTVLNYVNFLRCNHARSLLASGKYNVGESAIQSGFSNLSYFSRTYRRMMGELPSVQREQTRAGE